MDTSAVGAAFNVSPSAAAAVKAPRAEVGDDPWADGQCCDGGRSLVDRQFNCCCCWRLHIGRLPELLFLILLTGLAFYQMNIIVVNLQPVVRLFLVPITLKLLFVYILVSLFFLFYCNFGRFRVVALVLALLSMVLFLLPFVALRASAFAIEGKLKNTFNSSTPPRAMSSPLDLGDWLLRGERTWGPYGTSKGDFEMKTFSYMSNMTGPPNKTGCGEKPERDWKPNLDLDVYFPKTKANDVTKEMAPIILHIHGGSWVGGDKNQIPYGSAYFTDRGYGLVSAEYNLACYGYSALDMVAELTVAFDFVRNKSESWGFDNRRIFVTGFSAGGHLALMLGYTLDSPVCGGWESCGIKGVYNSCGPSGGVEDPALLHGQIYEYIFRGLTNGARTLEETRIYFPLHYVTKNSPPTTSFHSTWDIVVPIANSLVLHEKLDELGVKNVLIGADTYGHVSEFGFWTGPGQMFRFAFERLLWQPSMQDP